MSSYSQVKETNPSEIQRGITPTSKIYSRDKENSLQLNYFLLLILRKTQCKRIEYIPVKNTAFEFRNIKKRKDDGKGRLM